MSPESSQRLNELLNKFGSHQISSEEYAELQELLRSIEDLNEMPPLTQSGTISEAAMNQLLDGFSDTQLVLEEIQTRVKEESAQRKRIIDKLLKIHAVINASKARQSKLQNNRQLIEDSLNPATKPEDSIDARVAQVSQTIALELAVATNLPPLDSTKLTEFTNATAMGLIQDQEDAVLVLSVIAPQPNTALAVINQELSESFHFLNESDRISLLEDATNLESKNDLNPLSENGFQVDIERINNAVTKHLNQASQQVDQITQQIDLAAHEKPKLLDLPTQISQINKTVSIALRNTITSGVFEKVNIDNDLKAITQQIALQALKDNPAEVRFLSNKADQIASIKVLSPSFGSAAELQSKRISPQASAQSARKLNLPTQPSFRVVLNQVRINRSSILKTELAGAKPTKFDAFFHQSPFVRFAPQYQTAIHAFTNPSRTIGNYMLTKIGQQTGKTFLKDFAHGMVAAENATARNLAGQLVGNVLKLGVKEGFKATASALTSTAAGAAGATAGGAAGAVAGPVGIILGIAVGFLIDKTIGLIGKGLNSLSRALTGDDLDWKAVGGMAIAGPIAGVAFLSSFVSMVFTTVSFVFISPVLLAIILGVYIFFWIPTINVAPLLSTLVHLESGSSFFGSGGEGAGGPVGRIESTNSCIKLDPSSWTGAPSQGEQLLVAADMIAANYPGLMNRVCSQGTVTLIYDPLTVDYCGEAYSGAHAIRFNNFNSCFGGTEQWMFNTNLAHELGHLAATYTDLLTQYRAIAGGEVPPMEHYPIKPAPAYEYIPETFGIYVACNHDNKYCNDVAQYHPKHMEFARIILTGQ